MIKPYYEEPGIAIYHGDARKVLTELPEESVQCVVTSPPYWGLRDYGLPPLVWGGDAACEHEWGEERTRPVGNAPSECSTLTTNNGRGPLPGDKYQHERTTAASHGAFCSHCSAWRGSLGLEPTPELYIQHLVEIFREVKRVLRRDGTVWLNLGDSYCSTAPETWGTPLPKKGIFSGIKDETAAARKNYRPSTPAGLKPKDLCMIPARVALALQADGWWLRSDIIWNKPNPMPESVTDRPTRSHEYLFLLTKVARYYYDSLAIAEKTVDAEAEKEYNYNHDTSRRNHYPSDEGEMAEVPEGSGLSCEVQKIRKTQSRFKEILREGKREGGDRPLSKNPQGNREFIEGYPQKTSTHETGNLRSNSRSMEANQREPKQSLCNLFSTKTPDKRPYNPIKQGRTAHNEEYTSPMPFLQQQEKQPVKSRNRRSVWTIATQPYKEAHFATFPEKLVEPCILASTKAGDTVLDPFGGSGVTGVVAKKLGRRAILIDLKREYCEMAVKRLPKQEVLPLNV